MDDSFDAILLKAAGNGDWAEISRLLDKGMDIDKKLFHDACFVQVTALSKASEYGHIECVQKLVERGAGSDGMVKYKYALVMAGVKEHSDCFRFLVENRLFKAVDDRQKYQVFIDACRRRNFDQIQKLLVENEDRDILNGWKGNNLMSLCVVYGCPPACLQLLIDQGVDVNGYDYNGFTPLMCAVLVENVSLIRFLLGLGVNINTQTVHDTRYFLDDRSRMTEPRRNRGYESPCTTALMYAACFRNNESLRVMLQYCSDNDVDINYHLFPDHWAAIDYAAYFGNRDSVSLLLKSGSVLRSSSVDDDSIHHHAMKHHRPDILELTLAADADLFPMILSNADVCLLDVNCLRLVLKYLNDCSEREQWFMMLLDEAAENGTIDIFRLLLEQAPEINDRDDRHGNTMLMRVCVDKHEEKFDLLIKLGANIHIQDNEGNTAIMCAAKNKAVKCLEKLLSNEANINVNNHKGETPLMIACATGHVECVDLLIKSGADVTAQTNDRRTAIAYVSTVKCLQQLMEHGADIHVKDKQGKTTLMFACEEGFEEVVEFLIKHGLDINAQDESGKTAMMYAVKGPYVSDDDKSAGERESENEKCLKLLFDEGADVDLNDKEEGTVFSIAMCRGGSCVDMLLHSGKLLCDGVLKPKHKRAMRVMNEIFKFNVKCVMSAMEFGIFEWDWCLLSSDFLSSIAFAAVLSGFSPGKIKYKDVEISLLHLAFIRFDFCCIKFLLAHRYLLPEDLRFLTTDDALTLNSAAGMRQEDLLSIVGSFKNALPLSLQTLSFLTVSMLLSNAKSSLERSSTVDALALSEEVKKCLKFKTNVFEWCPRNCSEMEIDTVLDSLNFFREAFSWDENFWKCSEDCYYCGGFGFIDREDSQ